MSDNEEWLDDILQRMRVQIDQVYRQQKQINDELLVRSQKLASLYESLTQRCKPALVIIDILADALLNTDCTCSADCNCGRQSALDAFKSYANGTFKIEDLP